MNRHEKYIAELYKLAQDSEGFGNARVVACIVRNNTIISYGFNQKKSHPFQAKYSSDDDAIFLHAETDAIKNAIKRFNSLHDFCTSILYVARAKRDHSHVWHYGLAKPCVGCARAIANFGIKRVYFTTNDGEYKYM